MPVAKGEFHLRGFSLFVLRRGVAVERIVETGRRRVRQRHARLDAVLQAQIAVEVGGRPEIGHGDLSVAAAEPIDPAEALHEPNRVPVNVVVHHQVAILKVLAFRQAIGGDEDVDFIALGAGLLRPGREPRQNIEEFRRAGAAAVAAAAGHQRDTGAEFLARPAFEMIV